MDYGNEWGSMGPPDTLPEGYGAPTPVAQRGDAIYVAPGTGQMGPGTGTDAGPGWMTAGPGPEYLSAPAAPSQQALGQAFGAANAASRYVTGSGGYVYEQTKDGTIYIRGATDSRATSLLNKPITQASDPGRWHAITAEIKTWQEHKSGQVASFLNTLLPSITSAGAGIAASALTAQGTAKGTRYQKSSVSDLPVNQPSLPAAATPSGSNATLYWVGGGLALVGVVVAGAMMLDKKKKQKGGE